MVIWITGLPGAGKTTIASLLLEKIRESNRQAVLLDGDLLREALDQHAYDIDSRKKLALTYSRLAKMFSEQGAIAICATVSMFDSVREWNARHIDSYFEVYLKVPESVLNHRNQKELYSKAESGEVVHVHGFDIAIEEPKSPDLLIVNNGCESPERIVKTILSGLST